MSFDEAQAIVATKTAPKVTKESIEGRIQQRDYLHHGLTTICIITMVNQFKVIGHSTPASPANYDSKVGEAYAYDNAFRQIWQLEGYLLRERLSEARK
jgi:hypothetical protein